MHPALMKSPLFYDTKNTPPRISFVPTGVRVTCFDCFSACYLRLAGADCINDERTWQRLWLERVTSTAAAFCRAMRRRSCLPAC